MKPFDEFWKLYPHGRRAAKGKCRSKYEKLVKKGLHPEIMKALHLQIKAYNTKVKAKKTKNSFVRAWKLSETWLNGECWEDDIETLSPVLQNRYYNLDTEKTPAEKEMDRQQEKIEADKAWAHLAKLAKMKVGDLKQESLEKCRKKYGKE